MTQINKPVRRQRQMLVLIATIALFLSCFSPVSAFADEPGGSGDDPVSIEQIISDQLAEFPGGTVVDNEIHYDDGSVFVAVLPGVYSISQCQSGRFCGWTNANYLGSFHWVTSSGPISWTARSYYNNRAGIARLYNASGSSSLCFTPHQARATVGAAYRTPSKVKLTSATSC